MNGKVALVTGASRGIGRGIALQLAKSGCTVYITGRGGGLATTAAEITAAGAAARGRCIAVVCDHSNDAIVEALFEQIITEQGQLDVLVNNAYAGVKSLHEWKQKPFWEKPLSAWDNSCDVGLRSAYVGSALAAVRMVERGSGLIVNVSSAGGLAYAGFVGDVAYGTGKCALDRLTNDMALELQPKGVSCVSLWPGMVRTEFAHEDESLQKAIVGTRAESVEFAGIAVVKLALHPEAAMERTGMVLITTELAAEFGYTDVDGAQPRSINARALRLEMAKPPRHWTYSSTKSRL
jgi:dehydrogenase/reductase SDR family protein 1